jgi:FAD-linked oxidoreductase
MPSDFTYHNWAETIQCHPGEYDQPTTVEEVVQIVRRAEAEGKVVRVFGGRHSWSKFVLTDGALLNLDSLNKILAIDPDTHQVTIQAGMRIKDLVNILQYAGLGLKNLGSIMEQSFAGAISTGTHGTGRTLGSLHTQVVGMKIVSGGGKILEISSDDSNYAEMLSAAQVSLGALGVVVELTLQCVPLYNVRLKAWSEPYEDVLSRLDTLIADNQRVRFYWLSGTDEIYVNTMNDTDDPSHAVSPFMRWFRETVLRHDVLAALMEIGNHFPNAIGSINRFEAFVGYSEIDEVGPYFQELPVGVYPRHIESEYAVPIERSAEAIRICRTIVERHDNQVTLPTEFRFVQGDNAMLSPAAGRDSCYICAQTSDMDLAMAYFNDFEPAMKQLGGRPHWGKILTLTAAEVEAMYPDYHRFVALRRELDPRGTFASDGIRELFG